MEEQLYESAYLSRSHARFRPILPDTLVKRIISYLKEKYCGPLLQAVDVGCGTGQCTASLCPYFNNVVGMDISSSEMNEALQKRTHGNASYRITSAESLPFPDQSLQLLTTTQVFHWFDKHLFFHEAKRVLCPGGVVAIYGYDFPRPIYKDKSEELYQIMLDAYVASKAYWGNESEIIEEQCRHICIPFPETDSDDTLYSLGDMTLEDMVAYISSWSGFQNCQTQRDNEEAYKIIKDYKKRFLDVIDVDSSPESVTFTTYQPYFLKLGRKS